MEFYLYILTLLALAAIFLFAGRALLKKREIKFLYCYHALVGAIVVLYLIHGPVPVNYLIGTNDGEGGMANILVLLWIYASIYLSYIIFLVGYFAFSIKKLHFLYQLLACLLLQTAVGITQFFLLERGMFF